MIDTQRLRRRLARASSSKSARRIRRLALDPVVLALFAFLAGPLLAIQAFDLHVTAASILAIPGYTVLSVLAAVFALLRVGGEELYAVGTPGFYLLHTGWSYLVALASVVAGRAIARRLRR